MRRAARHAHLPGGASRRRESGASAVKVIVSLAVLLFVAHTAYVFIPLYVAVYDFDQQAEREANFGSQKTSDAIVKALLAHATERGLPVKKENVKVTRTNSRLTVVADYTVPIKMLFYTHNWHVSVEKSAVLF